MPFTTESIGPLPDDQEARENPPLAEAIAQQRDYNRAKGGPIRCSLCEELGKQITDSHLGGCPFRPSHDQRSAQQMLSDQFAFERSIFFD